MPIRSFTCPVSNKCPPRVMPLAWLWAKDAHSPECAGPEGDKVRSLQSSQRAGQVKQLKHRGILWLVSTPHLTQCFVKGELQGGLEYIYFCSMALLYLGP